jgi:2-C-methyl-D-erythritol 4-phosphate cytidylyltransferase
MIWTIVLAAGSGSRFGRIIPKQYDQLGGRRVLDWSVSAAREVSDGVVLVVPPEHEEDDEPTVDAMVVGGSERSDSVRRGLDVIPDSATVILVHDAARPLATAELYRQVIRAVRSGADGAVPALPVVDTIKEIADGRVVKTLPRRTLVAVQTPQGFRADALRDAHATGDDATDDAALIEQGGGSVTVVDGEAENFKITVPADLDRAEALL